MQGMDPNTLDEFADTLERLAGEVLVSTLGLSLLMAQLQWQGADADAARAHWDTSVKPLFNDAVENLMRDIRTARAQVAEQRKVSAT